MTEPTNHAPRLKRSSASLTGGLVVAVTAAALTALVLTEAGVDDGPTRLVLAVVVAALSGGYVRLADL